MAQYSHADTIAELKKAKQFIVHQEELRAKVGVDASLKEPKAAAPAMGR